MRSARSIAVLALIGATTLAGPALAQSAVASATPAPTALPYSGEPTSLSGFRASSPMRLMLEGEILPIGGQFPQCQGLEDEAGNSVGRIPVQHYEEVTLVPHLVLSGFSQLGCPIDAGIGGELTYALPLRASTWLVLGAGGYGVPSRLPLYGGLFSALNPQLLTPPVTAALRADVVWSSPSGRTFNLGVQTRGLSRQLVSFGSTF